MFYSFKVSHPDNKEIWTRILVPGSDIKLVVQESAIVNMGTEEAPDERNLNMLRIITKNVVKTKKPILKEGVPLRDSKGKVMEKVVEDYETFTIDNKDEIESLLSQLGHGNRLTSLPKLD